MRIRIESVGMEVVNKPGSTGANKSYRSNWPLVRGAALIAVISIVFAIIGYQAQFDRQPTHEDTQGTVDSQPPNRDWKTVIETIKKIKFVNDWLDRVKGGQKGDEKSDAEVKHEMPRESVREIPVAPSGGEEEGSQVETYQLHHEEHVEPNTNEPADEERTDEDEHEDEEEVPVPGEFSEEEIEKALKDYMVENGMNDEDENDDDHEDDEDSGEEDDDPEADIEEDEAQDDIEEDPEDQDAEDGSDKTAEREQEIYSEDSINVADKEHGEEKGDPTAPPEIYEKVTEPADQPDSNGEETEPDNINDGNDLKEPDSHPAAEPGDDTDKEHHQPNMPGEVTQEDDNDGIVADENPPAQHDTNKEIAANHKDHTDEPDHHANPPSVEEDSVMDDGYRTVGTNTPVAEEQTADDQDAGENEQVPSPHPAVPDMEAELEDRHQDLEDHEDQEDNGEREDEASVNAVDNDSPNSDPEVLEHQDIEHNGDMKRADSGADDANEQDSDDSAEGDDNAGETEPSVPSLKHLDGEDKDHAKQI